VYARAVGIGLGLGLEKAPDTEVRNFVPQAERERPVLVEHELVPKRHMTTVLQQDGGLLQMRLAAPAVCVAQTPGELTNRGSAIKALHDGARSSSG
jgi:hypothetical protein